MRLADPFIQLSIRPVYTAGYFLKEHGLSIFSQGVQRQSPTSDSKLWPLPQAQFTNDYSTFPPLHCTASVVLYHTTAPYYTPPLFYTSIIMLHHHHCTTLLPLLYNSSIFLYHDTTPPPSYAALLPVYYTTSSLNITTAIILHSRRYAIYCTSVIIRQTSLTHHLCCYTTSPSYSITVPVSMTRHHYPSFLFCERWLTLAQITKAGSAAAGNKQQQGTLAWWWISAREHMPLAAEWRRDGWWCNTPVPPHLRASVSPTDLLIRLVLWHYVVVAAACLFFLYLFLNTFEWNATGTVNLTSTLNSTEMGQKYTKTNAICYTEV